MTFTIRQTNTIEANASRFPVFLKISYSVFNKTKSQTGLKLAEFSFFCVSSLFNMCFGWFGLQVVKIVLENNLVKGKKKDSRKQNKRQKLYTVYLWIHSEVD